MNVTLIANTPEPQRLIETCARISYESQNYPFDPEVNSKFIRKLIVKGHESPFEHASATFLIEGISRTCSHQIVRHRMASFSQRSDRYVEFDMSDPRRCPSFTLPKELQDFMSRTVDEASGEDSPYAQLRKVMCVTTTAYRKLIEAGIPKEDARLVMPQGVQTSLYMTANFREWRHFLRLRLDGHAQWEIRGVAKEVLGILFHIAPDCFHDLVMDELEKNIVEAATIRAVARAVEPMSHEDVEKAMASFNVEHPEESLIPIDTTTTTTTTGENQ